MTFENNIEIFASQALLFIKLLRDRIERDIKNQHFFQNQQASLKCISDSSGASHERDEEKLWSLFTEDDDLPKDLHSFAFEVFRSYEPILCDSKYKKNFLNITTVVKFNEFIDFVARRLFENLVNEPNFTNVKGKRDELLLKSFFKKPTNVRKEKYKLAQTINTIGIVIINKNSKKRRYFDQSESLKDNSYYRLLNNLEKSVIYSYNGKNIEEKLFDLTGIQYVERIHVDNNYKYYLKNYTTYKLVTMLRDNNFQEFDNFMTFQLPDLPYLYVQRPNKTDKIQQSLNESDAVAICGVSGIGKTLLAIDFATKSMESHNIFWIESHSEESLEKSFNNLYKRIFDKKIDEKYSMESILKDIYGKYQTNSLFIFDNALNLDSLVKYLPKSSRKFNLKILITSQSRKWYYSDLYLSIVELGVMEVSEGMKLVENCINSFTERYALEYNLQLFDRKEEDLMVKVLLSLLQSIPRYPLIIKQASMSIAQNFRAGITLKNDMTDQVFIQEINAYLKKDNLNELLNTKTEEGEAVYNTIVFLIKKLEIQSSEDKYNENVHKVALGVLNMMSYFALSYVPKYFFMFYCNEKYKSSDDRQFLLDVTDLLVDNMIVKSINDQMTIEELVQIVNRKYLKEKDVNVVESILREGIRCVVEYLQSNPLSDVIQHLTSLWEYASNYENIVKEFIANQQGYYKLNILVRNEKKANKGNTTMLHIIAQYNELEVIKRIVKIIKETDDSLLMDLLNKRNHLHRTPLECATEGGNLDVVKLFFQLNPNSIVSINETLNERPKQWSPLQIATKNGHKDIVDYLIEKNHGIGGVTKYGYTLAHIAAENGSYVLLKMFVNAENVNQCTDYNFTPLHLACHVDNVQSVKLLIELGANCEAVTKYGKTALHFAADRGFDDIVQVLLSHSDNLVKMKDNKGFTPLHWAAFSNHPSTVDILLKKNKRIVNEQNTEGNTPLHLAVKEGHMDVVKMLIKYGANVKKKNNDMKLAIDLSCNDDLKALLRKSNFLF